MRMMARMELSLTKNNFKMITNSSVVALEMVKQGHGIGLIPNIVAEQISDLIPLLPDAEPISGAV